MPFAETAAERIARQLREADEHGHGRNSGAALFYVDRRDVETVLREHAALKAGLQILERHVGSRTAS